MAALVQRQLIQPPILSLLLLDIVPDDPFITAHRRDKIPARYAQVIWAHMAILILTFVGPLMIPWLVFEPMAFLFWGWFRAMITFALYGAIAGAIMRVFMSVSLGFLTTFLDQADVENPVQMVSWLLILLPLMVAGVIASLKVGELAGMLVSGGGGGGAGMTGALMMAATGGKAMLAGKAAGAAGVK